MNTPPPALKHKKAMIGELHPEASWLRFLSEQGPHLPEVRGIHRKAGPEDKVRVAGQPLMRKKQGLGNVSPTSSTLVTGSIIGPVVLRLDFGQGGGGKVAGTSIETIRGVYTGIEALILVPTQPLLASLIDSPIEKRKKKRAFIGWTNTSFPLLLALFLYYTSCRIMSITHKGIHKRQFSPGSRSEAGGKEKAVPIVGTSAYAGTAVKKAASPPPYPY
ncbi:hypothetical protein NE237_032664 [Protea cynaroides]|uniref:Uncharacterized protein n=1 Tax=Protea cynaroides TaxID=273540 RepID=A0A9Q0L3R0_9MAGN|nr:hypothetical protein NE237_032664 [Protea cynaroides]